MAYDWALVAQGGDKPPQAWNLYHDKSDAMRALEEDRKDLDGRPYACVMPSDDYIALKTAWLLAPERNPLKPITADAFEEALNVLPPLGWHNRDGIERFMLVEMYSGTLTHQYARMGALYCSRLVDVADRSTWITRDEIRALRCFDPAKVILVRKRFSVTQGEVEVSYDGRRIEQYGDDIEMRDTPEPGAQVMMGFSGRGDAFWIDVARRVVTQEAQATA